MCIFLFVRDEMCLLWYMHINVPRYGFPTVAHVYLSLRHVCVFVVDDDVPRV